MHEYGYYMRERVQVYGKPIAVMMEKKIGQHDEAVTDQGDTKLYRFVRDVLRVGPESITAYRCRDVAQAQRILENFRVTQAWPITSDW